MLQQPRPLFINLQVWAMEAAVIVVVDQSILLPAVVVANTVVDASGVIYSFCLYTKGTRAHTHRRLILTHLLVDLQVWAMVAAVIVVVDQPILLPALVDAILHWRMSLESFSTF